MLFCVALRAAAAACWSAIASAWGWRRGHLDWRRGHLGCRRCLLAARNGTLRAGRVQAHHGAVVYVKIEVKLPGRKRKRVHGCEPPDRRLEVPGPIIILPGRRVILHPRELEPVAIACVRLGRDVAEAVVDDVVQHGPRRADDVPHRIQLVGQIPRRRPARARPGEKLIDDGTVHHARPRDVPRQQRARAVEIGIRQSVGLVPL